METKANYVLIGAFTILVAIFGLLFALWAAKYSSDRTWQAYDVIFNEPVTGLTEGSSVQYNGISVGTVENLKLAPNDPRSVIARLKLQADAPIKVDTKAKLSQQGLTGGPFIQLTGGSPSAPRIVAVDQREVPVIATEPSALQNIADTASRLVQRMDQVLSEENVKRIADTLENLRGVTGSINAKNQDIEQLITNARLASEDLRNTLQTTNGAVQRIDREVVAQLPAMMDKLDRAATALESASNNVDALVAENRAPLSRFSRDGLQQLGPTLSELRALIRDVRQVANGLERNPAGYILGRQQPKEFVPQ